jgi:hypothetical protein
VIKRKRAANGFVGGMIRSLLKNGVRLPKKFQNKNLKSQTSLKSTVCHFPGLIIWDLAF